MRMLQPAYSKADERTYSTRSAWTAVAATAGALMLGGGSLTSCEWKKKTNVVDPQTYPVDEEGEPSNAINGSSIQATSSSSRASGLKDPMSGYGISSANREPEKENNGQDGASAQAVSPKEKEELTIGKKYLNDMSAEELRLEESARKNKQHSGGLKLFSGNGNMALALEIARHLGISLGKATVGRFADGEANVVIHENIRGKDVYIIQPTCPPVNDNMMELLLMVSTLRRASARRITVVIPYYGYARQDRKMQVGLDYSWIFS
jgi:hypothetical protein